MLEDYSRSSLQDSMNVLLFTEPINMFTAANLLLPILIQIYPLHIVQPYSFIIHFSIILQIPVSQVVYFYVSLMRATCPVACYNPSPLI